MKDKVILGMSGGVDSSISAYILQQQGYEVIGLTLKIYNTSKTDISINDAIKTAKDLNIQHHILDVSKEFNDYIIQYFISEYLKGRTPNPCVICNRYVKFEGLIQKAKELNIPYISTGHYANVEKVGDRYILKRAKSISKDQTYFLYNLTQEQLSKTIFTLGIYEKEEIRNIAKEISLEVADKEDSQEICFLENNNYYKFIEDNSPLQNKEGNIVDINGNILGKHNGIYKYTIGQRHGLGISLNKPMYVKEIDLENNEVILADEEDIFSRELIAKDINLLSIDSIEKEIEATAKIRYGAKDKECTIKQIDENKIKVVFKDPQRAITPGQAVVFYDKDIVIGGGVIV